MCVSQKNMSMVPFDSCVPKSSTEYQLSTQDRPEVQRNKMRNEKCYKHGWFGSKRNGSLTFFQRNVGLLLLENTSEIAVKNELHSHHQSHFFIGPRYCGENPVPLSVSFRRRWSFCPVVQSSSSSCHRRRYRRPVIVVVVSLSSRRCRPVVVIQLSSSPFPSPLPPPLLSSLHPQQCCCGCG